MGNAMPEKQKKKLTKKIFRIEDKLDILYTTVVAWLFVVFCITVLFDQLVAKIFFPFIQIHKGMGLAQVIVAVGIIVNMWWLKRMMGK